MKFAEYQDLFVEQYLFCKDKKKILNMVEIIVGALFLIGFIACIILQVTSPDGAFTVWIKENVWHSQVVRGGIDVRYI